MLTSNYTALSSVSASRLYAASAERDCRVRAPRDGRGGDQFDSVTLSANGSGEQRFRMELTGRLTQEIRASTTTGDIRALRQQVADREYVPDAMEIARRILFLGGES